MATVPADLVDSHADPDDHAKQAEGEERHRERNLLDRGSVVHDERPRIVVPDGERVVDIRHCDIAASPSTELLCARRTRRRGAPNGTSRVWFWCGVGDSYGVAVCEERRDCIGVASQRRLGSGKEIDEATWQAVPLT